MKKKVVISLSSIFLCIIILILSISVNVNANTRNNISAPIAPVDKSYKEEVYKIIESDKSSYNL